MTPLEKSVYGAFKHPLNPREMSMDQIVMKLNIERSRVYEVVMRLVEDGVLQAVETPGFGCDTTVKYRLIPGRKPRD